MTGPTEATLGPSSRGLVPVVACRLGSRRVVAPLTVGQDRMVCSSAVPNDPRVAAANRRPASRCRASRRGICTADYSSAMSLSIVKGAMSSRSSLFSIELMLNGSFKPNLAQ